MNIVVGAILRELGKSNHREHDDYVAGALALHQISPAGRRERESQQALATMLLMGFSPDSLVARKPGRKPGRGELE